MHKKFDVVGFGICTVDFLGLVANYPEAEQKIKMAAFSKQGGGLVGTALTAAARLGAKTAYIGKFGRDEYSQFLLDEFRKDGVEVSQVIVDERAQPPVSFIHVEKKTGARRVTWYWNDFELQPHELNRAAIESSKILFLDHFHTAAGLAAANCIKASGGFVVVDAERFTPGFDAILTTADYIISSRKFAELQTGSANPPESARLLRERYGGTIVVTAGEQGAFCQTAKHSFHQPAFSVEVVDTTGAGDVFHGAFMAGLARNWPLSKILEFSAGVAALKCRGLGGREPIPTNKEVFTFLKENGTAKFWSEI
jgi:ribokinase